MGSHVYQDPDWTLTGPPWLPEWPFLLTVSRFHFTETFSSCNQFCLTLGQSQWMLLHQVSLRSNEDKNYSVALSSQRNGQGLERPRVGGHLDLRAPHPTARVPHAPKPG